MSLINLKPFSFQKRKKIKKKYSQKNVVELRVLKKNSLEGYILFRFEYECIRRHKALGGSHDGSQNSEKEEHVDVVTDHVTRKDEFFIIKPDDDDDRHERTRNECDEARNDHK